MGPAPEGLGGIAADGQGLDLGDQGLGTLLVGEGLPVGGLAGGTQRRVGVVEGGLEALLEGAVAVAT